MWWNGQNSEGISRSPEVGPEFPNNQRGSIGLTNGRRKTDQRDMSSGRRVEALTESCMICPAGLSGTNILRRSGLTVEERFSKTRDRNLLESSCTSRMR